MQKILNKKNNVLIKFYIIILALSSIDFFSFLYFPKKSIQFLEIGLLAILTLVIVYKQNPINNHFKNFSLIFKVLIFTVIISVFLVTIIRNQSLSLSVYASLPIFYFLIYWLFHKYDIDQKWLLKLIVSLGSIWVFISIIQSIIPNNLILFKSKDLDILDLAKRSRGLITRIQFQDVRYAIFLLLFLINKYVLLKKIRLLIFCLFTVYAIYLTGTRQLIFLIPFMFLIAIIFSDYNLITRNLLLTILFIPIIILVGVFLFPYFNFLIELTFSQIESSNFNRVQSFYFFLFDYWPDYNKIISFLFGNGPHHFQSDYGKEIEYIGKYLRLYRSDVGLIGALNKFGFIYVLLTIVFYIKILRSYVSEEFRFLKFFIIFLLLTSFSGANFFEKPSIILIFAAISYIVDLQNQNYNKFETVNNDD